MTVTVHKTYSLNHTTGKYVQWCSTYSRYFLLPIFCFNYYVMIALLGELFGIPPVTSVSMYGSADVVPLLKVLLFGPFLEELLYRFAPINLMKKRILIKIIIMASIFSIVHVNPSYGFPLVFVRIIPIFIISVFLSLIYCQTGSLLLISVLHITYNILAVAWDISLSFNFNSWLELTGNLNILNEFLQSAPFLFSLSLVLFIFCLVLYVRIRSMLKQRRLSDFIRLATQPEYSNWLIIVLSLAMLEAFTMI